RQPARGRAGTPARSRAAQRAAPQEADRRAGRAGPARQPRIPRAARADRDRRVGRRRRPALRRQCPGGRHRAGDRVSGRIAADARRRGTDRARVVEPARQRTARDAGWRTRDGTRAARRRRPSPRGRRHRPGRRRRGPAEGVRTLLPDQPAPRDPRQLRPGPGDRQARRRAPRRQRRPAKRAGTRVDLLHRVAAGGLSASRMAWRRIAHLDMDAFYASVELLRRPELRGHPVAIGGHGEPSRRGVVTTATYEARAFGIRSGMALRRAAELCPDCVFLPVDFDEYRRYSRRFKAAIAAVTDRIEDRGIDEVYLDLTAVEGIRLERGAPVARDIQRRVFDATGLSCSIGLAPNKLLAKIASDLDKPAGLTIVDEPDVPTLIWPLPARRINGIGPKADQRLEE